MTGPYGTMARRYWEAGFSPLPLPPRKKSPPPDGFTGRTAPMASYADVEAWCETRWACNIALRLPPTVVGIDADPYKGPAEGAAWAQLVERYGPLPGDAPWCTSRDDGASGIRLLAVPDGYEVVADLGLAGEVIQHGHRYVVAPPSVHPDTCQPYRWRGQPGGWIPDVRKLPPLPAPWLDGLRAGNHAAAEGGKKSTWTDPDIDALIETGIPKDRPNHDDVLRDTVWKLRCRGWSQTQVRTAWRAIVAQTPLKDPRRPWTGDDFDRHWAGADSKLTLPSAPGFQQPGQAVRAAVPERAPEVPPGPVVPLAERLLAGGAILDVPRVPAAVWGDDEDIVWAFGQSVVIAGPDGVGKTTLAANLIRGRLGLVQSVLGLPVRPGERNVLILLMDRPQQAMAALARLFGEEHRALLDAKLRIWRGPPPQDLARNTGLLAELCRLAGADTCLVDSLKDAALKLSDDETGAGWNQARQLAIESGTQLVELHHPRKGQDGNRKPSKLDDLYGSRWISAGAGSVISLWGQAGDPVVEFTHLKPVVTTAGPWQMRIDGQTGIVSRDHGIDLIEQTRARGSNGMTAAVAAQLLYGSDTPSAREKARRRLDKKVADGLLVCKPGQGGGAHGGAHATYFATALTKPLTDRSRAGQALTPTQEQARSRSGGDISPPERERWPAGSIGAEANE